MRRRMRRRMQTTSFQRMRSSTRQRLKWFIKGIRLHPNARLKNHQVEPWSETQESKQAEREEVAPCHCLAFAACIELPIKRIKVRGCLSGEIVEYEDVLKELEMYQDNGMFKEHDELVKEKIRHYEEREAPTMVWVLKIEQSATYSYQDNWEQAWEQLVSVINSDLMVEYSDVIRAKVWYLLVAHMRRGKEYRKSKSGLWCLLNHLKGSIQLLYRYDSPEDWAELYQTYGCVLMDSMSQLPLDKRNVERENAIDCFRKAIDFSKEDPRERVQMKRQSYAHLMLAVLHLWESKENHLPLSDIKAAEKHLDIVQSKFGDTLRKATRMLLLKTQSDLFGHKGQYHLALDKAVEALQIAKRHGFKTELNILQDKIDCYQKKLDTHDQILSVSEKPVRQGACTTSQSSDSAESAARQVTSESLLPQVSEKPVRQEACTTSQSSDSAESAARQVTSESLLPPEKQSNRRTGHKGYKLQQKLCMVGITSYKHWEKVLAVKRLQKQRKEAKSIISEKPVRQEACTTSQSSDSAESAARQVTSESLLPPAAFKGGQLSDCELDELAGKIAARWEPLGIRLGISQDLVDEITANANDKPKAMLLRWRNTSPSVTPYKDLYKALCHTRVGLNNVAKEFCKETT